MSNISEAAQQAIRFDESARGIMGDSSYVAGAGLRKLVDGEFNIPGVITSLLIVGVIVFMYWAIRYR